MSHSREKRPHGMNARCERYGIAYLVICGRSKVIWRVTARTPGHFGHVFCTFYIYSLFIYYPHNIFIITNHHRIIISKNSPAIAYVLSNLSEVSVVEDLYA